MKCKELLKKLKSAGWYEVSQKGSHVKMRHKDFENSIVVPNHGSKEMATGTAYQILKAAKLKP